MTLTPPTRHRVGFLQTDGAGALRAAPASRDGPGLGTCSLLSVVFAAPSTGHDPTHSLIHHLGTTPTHSFIHPSHGTRPH